MVFNTRPNNYIHVKQNYDIKSIRYCQEFYAKR